MKAGFLSKKTRRGEQDFYLQITSLIDTLVIILVFMLMTLGSENINLEVASNLTLPSASQGQELTQGLKIVAKNDGIYVDEQKLVALDSSQVPKEFLSEEEKKVTPLFQKLSVLSRESVKAAKTSGIKFDGQILLQADKSIPLKTIKQILYSAARAGYHDFKFSVIKH